MSGPPILLNHRLRRLVKPICNSFGKGGNANTSDRNGVLYIDKTFLPHWYQPQAPRGLQTSILGKIPEIYPIDVHSRCPRLLRMRQLLSYSY